MTDVLIKRENYRQQHGNMKIATTSQRERPTTDPSFIASEQAILPSLPTP